MKVIVCRVRPTPNALSRKERTKLESLRSFCTISFCAISSLTPSIAFAAETAKDTTIVGGLAAEYGAKAAVAAATFGSGGPGFIIIQILLIAMVGGITAALASTIGYGNVSKLLVFVGTLVCIGLICDLCGGVLNKVMGLAGM